MELFFICLHVCKLLITGIILAEFKRIVKQWSVVDSRVKTCAAVLGAILVCFAHLVGDLIVYCKVGNTA